MTTPVLDVHLECIYLRMLMDEHNFSGLAVLIRKSEVMPKTLGEEDRGIRNISIETREG